MNIAANITPDTRTRLLAGVDALLGPAGASNQGLSYNALQHDYARRVAITLATGHAPPTIAMLEAETGTGKTLGYLVPLMLMAAFTGERAMVSTFTRHLQRQMVNKDARLASEWVEAYTGKKLHVARRIGRSGYFDASRCHRLMNATEAPLVKAFLYDALEWLAQSHSTGVIEDYLAQAGLSRLPDGLPRVLIALDSRSHGNDATAYRSDVAASQAADIVIVNHALLCLNTISGNRVLDDGRTARALVVDEADQLENAARSVLSESLSITEFKRRIEHAFDIGCLPALCLSDANALLDNMLKEASTARFVPVSHLPESIANGTKKLAKHLLTARIALETRKESNRLGADAAAELLEDAERFSAFAQSLETPGSDAGSLLASWSPVKSLPTLSLGSPDAGRVMGRLWSEGSPLHAAVLTSATLAVPGKPLPDAMDAAARKIGLIRHTDKHGDTIHHVPVELMQRYQQQRFGEMRFVLADKRTPSPTLKLDDDSITTNPVWLDYCASMIEQAHQAGGRTLVLAKSWNDAAALAERLHKRLPDMVTHQAGEPIAPLLDAYRGNPRAVLISPSAWEGVDLPGMVDQLVVTRTPTPPPQRDDNVRLRLHLKESGLAPKSIDAIIRSQDTDAARNQMRQGLGRGVRRATDSTTVWLADPRIAGPYGWRQSLEPAAYNAKTRQSTAMHDAIPARFKRAFEVAEVLCQDSGRITPEVLL